MDSHGLVAIVFNEAYAMTNDPDLARFAQGTIWFIEEAQDPIGGGWRYELRQRGDTSAVGWQLMALKSGKIMGLNINPRTYKRAAKFLDSVSNSTGSFYGYMNPPRGEPADARTAVGLLCRMYMGWDRDVPGLVDGVEALAERGPRVGSGSRHVLQLLRDPGDQAFLQSATRMEEMECKNAGFSDSKPGERRGGCGQLAFWKQRSCLARRRTFIQHIVGRHDPGSVLSIPAALRR